MGAQGSSVSADAAITGSYSDSGASATAEGHTDRSAPPAVATVSARVVVDSEIEPTEQEMDGQLEANAVARSPPVKRIATDAAATAAPTSAPPPFAPVIVGSTKRIADRLVAVQGVIKHAYPLQALVRGKVADAEEEDDNDAFGSTFSLGSGPCGRDAAHVIAWEVQLRDSYQTCYVFLYDKWAEAVRRFQRHYKVHVKGLGLVAIDHWDVGHDTEDVKRCYVVAEPDLLKKTAERSARLLPKAQGISIQIAFEEPQRVPESDQVTYLPEHVIHARDLYGSLFTPEILEKPVTARANPRGKRVLRDVDLGELPPSSYMYTKLGALIPGFANLYGVVVNMSLPKRSEGHDFYMSLHLIDETCPRREDAIQIMVFFPKLELMPRVLHVGDVVRFHKIRINRYHDRLQGVCSSRATRYLVLRHGLGDIVDQQTSSTSWTFEKYDEERFRQLSTWTKTTLPTDTTLPPACPQPPRMLGEMQYAESFVDVLVRVLHVQAPYQELTVARFIVWDGSGDATSSHELYEKLRREQADFIPDHGLLMEIVVDSCWLVIQGMGFLPKLTSNWSRFRNLGVSSEQANPATTGPSQWFELHFREVSSLMLTPETVGDVQARVQLHHGGRQPVASPELDAAEATDHDRGAMPTATSAIKVATQIPAHIADKVPVTLIHTVLTNTQVPRKYHCLARAIKLWPSEAIQLAKRKSEHSEEFIYSFVMRLEDASAYLDVIVHGADAERFFHGIPPSDLTKSTSSLALLEKRLTGLLQSRDALHFCIKSYKPPTGTDLVRYRLFDTFLQ